MGSDISTEKGAEKASSTQSKDATTLAQKLRKSRTARLNKILKADSVASDHADGDDDDAVSQNIFGGSDPELKERAQQENPKDYQFSFDNLVLEGGGAKGVAYIGALKYLEECGVLGQIRRFGGASVGAMTAMCLACGFTPQEIEENPFGEGLFLDASWGIFSLIPNLVRLFGWHPAQTFYNKIGSMLKKKTGNPDVTFQELYHKTGRELCIVVTNLSQMSAEYCHPKTTPDMPIRLAVRMSMSIPVLFSAVKSATTNIDGKHDMFVDGGVLSNYPIDCYDGWYLSMKPEDSFLKRLQPLCAIPHLMERSQRFGTTNDNTLGMKLYSEDEYDIMRAGLERRYLGLEPPTPTKKTKLFKEWEEERREKKRAESEHEKIVKAISAFLAVLRKHNLCDSDSIDKRELEAAFQDKAHFPDDQAEVLFGTDSTVDEVFALLDYDGNGQINFGELVRFLESNGMDLQTLFVGRRRQNIDGFQSFLTSLQTTLSNNVQRLSVQECDNERTIGINTGHVGTTAFTMEKADTEFAEARGYNSAKAFLQYYVVAHPDKVQKKSASPPNRVTNPETSFPMEDLVVKN